MRIVEAYYQWLPMNLPQRRAEQDKGNSSIYKADGLSLTGQQVCVETAEQNKKHRKFRKKLMVNLSMGRTAGLPRSKAEMRRKKRQSQKKKKATFQWVNGSMGLQHITSSARGAYEGNEQEQGKACVQLAGY